MPTGVAFGNGREQLLAAAERVLLREGASGLTSRAVTDEAGCAKGVLHRHFPDFDGFLVELVLRRIAALEGQAATVRGSVGVSSVLTNLVEALTELFDPVAVNIVALTTSRDVVRRRLREARSLPGVPLLAEAASMFESYLVAEQQLGRLPRHAEVSSLALTLVGAGHLIFADRDTPSSSVEALRRSVKAILGSAGSNK